jgi:hypothetical protein
MIKGLVKYKINGFKTKKAIIDFSYHPGEFPRKFVLNA